MNAHTSTSTETVMNHRMHRANGVLLHYVTAARASRSSRHRQLNELEWANR